MESPIECRMCGAESSTTYVDFYTKLCIKCASDEEYREHEQRVSGEY